MTVYYFTDLYNSTWKYDIQQASDWTILEWTNNKFVDAKPKKKVTSSEPIKRESWSKGYKNVIAQAHLRQISL